MTLLPMDYALLCHLIEFGGSVPCISIPTKLFAGDIPDGAPNLVDAGMIEHNGDMVAITRAGRIAASLTSFVQISGPAVDALDARKESGTEQVITEQEMRESFERVKSDLFDGISALSSKHNQSEAT